MNHAVKYAICALVGGLALVGLAGLADAVSSPSLTERQQLTDAVCRQFDRAHLANSDDPVTGLGVIQCGLVYEIRNITGR